MPPEVPLLYRFNPKPRKVVLLRASRIGDFICASPALRALRSALPGAEISMVTLPLIEDLVERSAYLDRFISFPGYAGVAEQFFEPRKVAAFFQVMQAEEFDLAIQMQGSGVYTNPFMLMLGAKETAGYIRPEDTPGLLSAALPIPQDGHEVDRVLALVKHLGAPDRGRNTEYRLFAQDHATAAKLLENLKRPLIGYHPFARDHARCWSVERYAQVARQLYQAVGGTPVLLGEAEGYATGQRLVEESSSNGVNYCGRTSLGVLGAVIAQLDVLITNDSGPAHIAYALSTPTVTIFGPADPARYGPPTPGPYRILLGQEAVTAGEVVEAAIELLQGARSSKAP